MYDQRNDVLYFTIGDKNNSYGDEDINNIVIMRDIDTAELTGVTILDFAKMCFNHDSRLSVLKKYFDPYEVLNMFNVTSMVQA